MKEHTHLLAEHDVPVGIGIVKEGSDVDWVNSLPEEILYIPEEVFHSCAPNFVSSFKAESYHGTTRLNARLTALLEADLEAATASDDLTVRDSAKEALQLITTWKDMIGSHYLIFEGP